MWRTRTASNFRLHFAHRHLLLHAQASQANHAAGTLQSNPALSSGHTEKNETKKSTSTVKNKLDQDFWLKSRGQASLPEQIPTCHPQRLGDTTDSTAQVFHAPRGGGRSKRHFVHPKACHKQFYFTRRLTTSHLALISSTTGHTFFSLKYSWFKVCVSLRGKAKWCSYIYFSFSDYFPLYTITRYWM